jgi:hypothetical protein
MPHKNFFLPTACFGLHVVCCMFWLTCEEEEFGDESGPLVCGLWIVELCGVVCGCGGG